MRAVWRLAVPLAFGLAGMLFVTSASASKGGELRGGGRSDLPDLIRAQEQRIDSATRDVERLRKEVDEASGSGQTDERLQAARQKAQSLSFAAGMGPLEGPGLTVTLDDAPRSADRVLPEGTSPDDLVVHQQDVQAVVNALWVGGAEAIQIMDQRLISTSAVRCAGNVLILQGRVYSPPYVITAIGDPDRMELALDSSENVQLYRYYADRYQLLYRTTARDQVRVPGYTGSLDLLYAEAPA
ncbi:MAG TPA: DUF881 domain-containing protein [Actinomycetes bacterium]